MQNAELLITTLVDDEGKNYHWTAGYMQSRRRGGYPFPAFFKNAKKYTKYVIAAMRALMDQTSNTQEAHFLFLVEQTHG